jgi:chemotaxis methyl-accepting protein methylase
MASRRSTAASPPIPPGTPADEVHDDPIAMALGLLRAHRGVDFMGYRPKTIRRRLDARMRLAGYHDLGAYLGRLRTDAEEREKLLGHLTIKVTRFHRNGRSFMRLTETALADLLARHPGRPLRIWSAGCSTGEEAWTLAMLLESAGAPGGGERPQIQATDVDEAALETARGGVYPVRSLVELPAALESRWIDRDEALARVDPILGRRVEFRIHDLIGAVAPPLGWRFDLICCRNVLIYLDGRRRRRVIELLHRSLRPSGYLFLGEAEWPEPVSEGGDLEVVDRRARIFKRPDDATRGSRT